jgi:ATP-dependent Clp protease adaptor protein ClpS
MVTMTSARGPVGWRWSRVSARLAALSARFSRVRLATLGRRRATSMAARDGEGGDRPGNPNDPGTLVITRTKPKTKRPNMYRVLLLNDDYTPMEFVVHVLERFFQKSREEATRVMLHVHHHGVGECGIYTYEVAETKVTQVMDFARKHQHPLQCVMEKK